MVCRTSEPIGCWSHSRGRPARAAEAAGERETGMSDRTPGSVRTGAGPAEGAAQADGTPRGATPDPSRSVSSTQSIPTGGVRAQGFSGPGTGGTPAQAGARGAVAAGGRPAGAVQAGRG